MKIRICSAQTAGSFHISNGNKCQDVMATAVREDEFMAVISDGAGSKEYARETAEAICGYVKDLFEKDRLRGQFEAGGLFDGLNGCIPENSRESGKWGATALILYFSGGVLYTAHVGDGAAVIDEGEGFELLSPPENGEYPWETFLLPSAKTDVGHFRTQKRAVDSPFVIVAGSDGVMTALYEAETGYIAAACGTMRSWITECSDSVCDEMLLDALSGAFGKINGDDKTILLISVK